jgi:acyl carrier protein
MNTEQRLSEWIRSHMAQVLGVEPECIGLDKELSSYGLDSVAAVLMAGELEEAFCVEIDPASFIDCHSFKAIIAKLAADIDKSSSAETSS